MPHRETEEEKDQKLKDEIARLKKEREKFTNVKAPEIEKSTHFGVTGSLDIGGEEEKEETGGFSLLSMFGRQVETDNENVNEEQSDENMEEEHHFHSQTKTQYLVGKTFGGDFQLFPKEFDKTGFYMEPDEIDKMREE